MTNQDAVYVTSRFFIQVSFSFRFEDVTQAAEIMLNASMTFACVLAIGQEKHAISVTPHVFAMGKKLKKKQF